MGNIIQKKVFQTLGMMLMQTRNFQYGNRSCPVIKHYQQNLTIDDELHKPNLINIGKRILLWPYL